MYIDITSPHPHLKPTSFQELIEKFIPIEIFKSEPSYKLQLFNEISQFFDFFLLTNMT